MVVLTYDSALGVFMRQQTNKDRTVSWFEPAGRRMVYGVRIRIDDHEVFAHHIVWRMVHGYWAENHVKHKDGDVGNNRADNLHTPGKDRKKPKSSQLSTFMASLGISDRQLKRMAIDRVKATQGEEAAINAEFTHGFIDKDERDERLTTLRDNP